MNASRKLVGTVAACALALGMCTPALAVWEGLGGATAAPEAPQVAAEPQAVPVNEPEPATGPEAEQVDVAEPQVEQGAATEPQATPEATPQVAESFSAVTWTQWGVEYPVLDTWVNTLDDSDPAVSWASFEDESGRMIVRVQFNSYDGTVEQLRDELVHQVAVDSGLAIELLEETPRIVDGFPIQTSTYAASNDGTWYVLKATTVNGDAFNIAMISLYFSDAPATEASAHAFAHLAMNFSDLQFYGAGGQG